MKRLGLVLALLGLLCTPAFAQIGGLAFPGPGPVVAGGGGGGGYTGPGDVVGGASAWWGLRAYSAAVAALAPACVDLVDQAGANPITINLKTDGTLDVAAIATWVAAHTVTTIIIIKLYDQTGNGFDLSNAPSLAARPTLVLGPVSGLAASRPSIAVSGSQSLTASNALTQTQPVSLGAVARRSNTSPGYAVASNFGNDPQIGFQASTQASAFAGSFATQTASPDGNFYALHGVFNGASTIMNVDGSSGTAGSTSNGFTSASLRIGNDPFGDFLTGNIQEGGVWLIGLSGANMTALSSNQHTYWGF